MKAEKTRRYLRHWLPPSVDLFLELDALEAALAEAEGKHGACHGAWEEALVEVDRLTAECERLRDALENKPPKEV